MKGASLAWQKAIHAGIVAGMALLLSLLVLAPLAMLIYLAVTSASPFGMAEVHWTLDNIRGLWSPRVGRAALNTLVIAAGGTAMALALGGTLAWLAARSDIPAKALVHVAGIMPVFISLLIAAVTWSLLASGRSGYLNLMFDALGLPIRLEVQSLAGIAFVSGLYYAPYPFILLYAALTLVHPDFEEAAAVHGAGLGRTLTRVTFPLVKPALIGSALLVFVLIAEDFPVPQILGGPAGIETLAVRIYNLMNRAPAQANEASAVALLLTAVVFAMVFTQRRVLSKGDYRTVTGKGIQPRTVPLGVWRVPAVIFVGLYLIVGILLPIFALVQSSVRANLFIPDFAALFDFSQMTFDHIVAAATDPLVQQGLKNSLLAGGITAVVGCVLYFSTAYMVLRTELPGRRYLEYLAMVPLAIPALVLALGVLWVWLQAPVPVYGTIAILVIAFTARFMPQGYRIIAGSIVQVHDDLEQAAMVSGATRLQAVRRITLPLLRGAVVSAAFLMLVLGIRELTASLFLYTSKTRVLSIVIYERFEDGVWSSVASISLIYTALLVILTIVGRRWMRAGV